MIKTASFFSFQFQFPPNPLPLFLPTLSTPTSTLLPLCLHFRPSALPFALTFSFPISSSCPYPSFFLFFSSSLRLYTGRQTGRQTSRQTDEQTRRYTGLPRDELITSLIGSCSNIDTSPVRLLMRRYWRRNSSRISCIVTIVDSENSDWCTIAFCSARSLMRRR